MKTIIKSVSRLKEILPKRSGRGNSGRISVRGRGGRQKRYYRIIDWKRDKRDMNAVVQTIEYDPNRSANISLVKYHDGEVRYIPHPAGLKKGDTILAGTQAPVEVGCAMPLSHVPIGVEIHNVELTSGRGAQIVRSAGASAVIVGKDQRFAHVKLPSGEIRKIQLACYAVIGKLDNEQNKHKKLRKAGSRRLMGQRPHVRGVAMHPSAHPHGGGEGRSGEGMHPKTPWGKPAKGKKTRKRKKSSNKLIVQRRK